MKLSTEEDVKIKIVLPYLKSLGFQEEELFLEKSFNLNLGKYAYKINTEKQYENALARLDILVKRNDKNLFIIEVKRDSNEINYKDVEQATSYARLVHPIVPFVVITNGIIFKIYNSLSREEINHFSLMDHYEISIPDEKIMYEALKHFLGYSKDNLLWFCRAQIHEGMSTLLGSEKDTTKKFIPALYTPRKNLDEGFKAFINNEASTFVIIGDSGSGKTSSMCNMALKLLEDNVPVLFYKASNLIWGIIKSISDDFNWVFSSQYSEIQVFRRIEELFESEKLIIFIDAIDEWNLPNKVEIINNFISKIRKKSFKLVLSCKTNAWSGFLAQRGTPTELSESIYTDNQNKKGYYLDEFNWGEISDALKKYRKFYHFTGGFEKQVLDECKRIPFILRVCFEVAQQYKLKHLTFSCKEFFDKYYEYMLNKIENIQVAEATIKGIAQCLFESNSDSMDMDILRNNLNLNINDSLMPSLFDYNVLEIVPGKTNNKIRFYFDKFRDYIIAFHVLKLGENPEPFSKLLHDGVHKEVMNFFYPFADINQKKTVDNLIRRNAERYLEFYIEVIKNYFPELKSRFSSFTEGDIGFIGEFNILERKLMLYGFRSLEGSYEERIKFIPWHKEFHNNDSNISYLHGARTLHWTSSADFFRGININREILKNEIEPQLRKIVKKGLLNEKTNNNLLIEKIIAIVMTHYSKQFGIKEKRKLSDHFPLSFDDIEYVMLYDKASRFYEDKLIQEKIDKGEIKEEREGSIVSYHYSASIGDSEIIHQQAELAAKNKIDVNPEARNVPFSNIEKTILEAMQHLRKQGINSIKENILPQKDRFASTGWVWDGYSYERLVEYILRVYQIFLEEYKKIIETNFYSIKNQFKLYSEMPIKTFITIRRHNKSCLAYIYICYNKEGREDETIIVNDGEVIVDDKEWNISYSGKEHQLINITHTDIFEFFGGYRHNYLPIGISREFIPIRNLVYNQIESEIDPVIDSLFEAYGLKKKE